MNFFPQNLVKLKNNCIYLHIIKTIEKYTFQHEPRYGRSYFSCSFISGVWVQTGFYSPIIEMTGFHTRLSPAEVFTRQTLIWTGTPASCRWTQRITNHPLLSCRRHPQKWLYTHTLWTFVFWLLDPIYRLWGQSCASVRLKNNIWSS